MQWTVNPGLIHNYCVFIQECLTSEELFSNFRRNEYFASIIGNGASIKEQQTLLDEIKEWGIDIKDKLTKLSVLDTLGNPPITNIVPYNVSSRTIRYLHTASKIKQMFSDIKSVIEIGSGYGGLCFTLGNTFNLTGYKLVDIDSAAALARKVLSKLPSITNGIEEEKFFNPQTYDLFVSESAISELDNEYIEYYYEKYIKNAKYIYCRMNLWDEIRRRFFIDLAKEFSIDHRNDDPNTPTSCILIGHRKNL